MYGTLTTRQILNNVFCNASAFELHIFQKKIRFWKTYALERLRSDSFYLMKMTGFAFCVRFKMHDSDGNFFCKSVFELKTLQFVSFESELLQPVKF